MDSGIISRMNQEINPTTHRNLTIQTAEHMTSQSSLSTQSSHLSQSSHDHSSSQGALSTPNTPTSQADRSDYQIHIKPGKQMIQINPGMTMQFGGKNVSFRLGSSPNTPGSHASPSTPVSNSRTSLIEVTTPISTRRSSDANFSTPTMPSLVSLNSLNSETKQNSDSSNHFLVTKILNSTLVAGSISVSPQTEGVDQDPNSPVRTPTSNSSDHSSGQFSIHNDNQSDTPQGDDGQGDDQSEDSSKKNPKWTADDDKSLKAAVLLQGGKNWKEISKMMNNKYTETQCLNRYKKVLNP